MSRRLRIAPVLLVGALGAALVLHMSPSRAGSTVDPAPTRAVDGVAVTVADMDRAVTFYSTVLFFDKVSDVRTAGTGGAGARVVTMRLGGERIELIEPQAGNAPPIRVGRPGADRWRQHIAIVVNDMDQAYLWLRRHHVAQLTPEPERPGDGDPSADGIRTFSFEDPDGHALEFLQFPPGRGDARWQRPSESIFLGIDHTGIVVKDTERSLAFYHDALGLEVVAASASHGPERERATGGPVTRLSITTVRASEGPAIELLEYLPPRAERGDLQKTSADGAVGWQTLLAATDAHAVAAKLGIRRGLTAADPDGHEVRLHTRK